MNQFFKRIVISLAAVFAGVMAFAQVTTSSISGKVSDANGALPGVTILALHEPTGTQYYAITDEKGNNAGEGFVRFALVPTEEDTAEAAEKIIKAIKSFK